MGKRETQWLAVIDSGAGQALAKGSWDDKELIRGCFVDPRPRRHLAKI